MQVEHKTEKGTLLWIKLPDDLVSFNQYEDMGYFVLEIKSQILGNQNITQKWQNIRLEQGFQLIGLTSEVTEEQCKMMVPLIKRVYGQSYYDYAIKFKVGYGYVGTALESFKSLMQHKEVYEVNPVEKPEIPKDTGYSDDKGAFEFKTESYNFSFKEWNESESRTGKWLVLFKGNLK